MLSCEIHGPLRFREGRCPWPDCPWDEPHWECAGFDGEAAGWCTSRVPEEARMRLEAGITRWPGVIVTK